MSQKRLMIGTGCGHRALGDGTLPYQGLAQGYRGGHDPPGWTRSGVQRAPAHVVRRRSFQEVASARGQTGWRGLRQPA